MNKRELSDIEVYELLCKIDNGYEPNAEECLELKSRTKLYLFGKRINVLPESIAMLKTLQQLSLVSTSITRLTATVGELTSLCRLDLSKTWITELPNAIWSLESLKELDLTGTAINELPNEIANLSLLESLSLSCTPLTELPESIGKLSMLQRLELRNVNISELPKSIVDLTCLQRLDLRKSTIVRLPETIEKLTALQKLDLGETGISELPDKTGELVSLQWLNLSYLRLKRLPKSLIKCGLEFTAGALFNGVGINLYGTRLIEQDKTVFLDTPELAEDLYTDQIQIKESKVIFLGDGGVGKTYSIRRIMNGGKKESEDNPYNTLETPGVEIRDYLVERGDDSFSIHFWDFGGQELLHSMHRCFLTDNTCYVVVVTSRNNDSEKRARYWLRNIKAFAPNSPVILYVNRWEHGDDKRVIDETRLKKTYADMIKDVVYCSAKQSSEADFREFVSDRIVSLATSFGMERRTANSKWVRVREAIEAENRKENYLTKERYHEICEQNGIKNENAPALLTFLNNIGVCFSYHRDREKNELAEYKLLSPVWLTNALYAIIEEGMSYATNGQINRSAIEQILYNSPPETINNRAYHRTEPKIRYSREKNECAYIIDVAAAHDLCYNVEGERLFFPALCNKKTPEEALNEPDGFPQHIEYRFVYKYLPDNVVHQLMIRCLKKDLSLKYCWLRGMVLGGMDNHKVYIRMADDEETLIVDVFSKNDHPAYEIFPLVRREVLDINWLLNLKAREVIASDEDCFTMVSLIQAYKDGTLTVYGDKSGDAFSPFDLLNRFFDSMEIPDMFVENGDIIIKPYKYHKKGKDDSALRRALFETYSNKDGFCVCQYCGKPITYDEMQVDHILAKKHLPSKDYKVEAYLAQLKDRGFDIDKPDYVENYLPSCRFSNCLKSNLTPSVVTLRTCHERALGNTPAVLEYMDKLKARNR